ncbi:MAG: STN domain-containing protein [Candidatus Synoicihabitans palmerolidicus]|nr:STN domain-containing protein [Candidatus Synoicihabitans palmerolidicus]
MPNQAGELWDSARGNFAAGNYDEVDATLSELITLVPEHRGAQRLMARVGVERVALAETWRGRTRSALIEEVGEAWRRPGAASEPTTEGGSGSGGANPLIQKLNTIRIPSVSFSAVELHRVVSTLSDLSREFDSMGGERQGINIVVIDPQDWRPTVSLTLRDLSLKRVLDFITDSIGYQYEVQADAVVVRPGGETSTLDTEFFPLRAPRSFG